ncbi:hypothetical protein [Streptomyces sp. NPDC018055]|uniref:hypothetical protein n=1 Tax=Streptomyces sp. NPDC018055 TaxID=3365038 RepID=UPI0037AF09E8
MPYDRGYTVESRGAYSLWKCQREGCEERGRNRGDEHEDQAAWWAAAHQHNEHREVLIREAAKTLSDAAEVLMTLTRTLTDVDTNTPTGPACMKPLHASQALKSWASQMKALLPDTDGTRLDYYVGQDSMCKHKSRTYAPDSWPVLVGIAEAGTRADPEVPHV